MTETKTVSYVDVLRRVAKRHDFEVENFESLTGTGQILLEDAAALRELAKQVERIIEADAEDARALHEKDPSAKASMYQYAEEEILSATAAIAYGFVPSTTAAPHAASATSPPAGEAKPDDSNT